MNDLQFGALLGFCSGFVVSGFVAAWAGAWRVPGAKSNPSAKESPEPMVWYEFATGWPILGPVAGLARRRAKASALIEENRRRIAACGFKHYSYVLAFDCCPPCKCKFCRFDLRMLEREVEHTSPNGETFKKRERVGFTCVRCGTGTLDDVESRQDHRRIEEYASAICLEVKT